MAREAPACRVDLHLDVAEGVQAPPEAALIERACQAALSGLRSRAEVAIRIVGEAESRQLNARYRHLDKATNVLSFPTDGLAEVLPDFLGDIAICAPLVAREAQTQGKAEEAHWSHLVVHGVLHLLGYDHDDDIQGQHMEGLERTILARLGYADPFWFAPSPGGRSGHQCRRNRGDGA